MPKIKCLVVSPSGYPETYRVLPGRDFSDRSGNRYRAAGIGDIMRKRILWLEIPTAIYEKGVPKPRPMWINPSPGLTGDDFENIEGDWLLGKFRAALKGSKTQEILNWIMLGACLASTGASLYACYMISKLG